MLIGHCDGIPMARECAQSIEERGTQTRRGRAGLSKMTMVRERAGAAKPGKAPLSRESGARGRQQQQKGLGGNLHAKAFSVSKRITNAGAGEAEQTREEKKKV